MKKVSIFTWKNTNEKKKNMKFEMVIDDLYQQEVYKVKLCLFGFCEVFQFPINEMSV